MKGLALGTASVLALLFGLTQAYAGWGFDIGPVHVNPTNPIAPITPRGTNIPNPVPPKIQKQIDKAGDDAQKTIVNLGKDVVTTVIKANKDTLTTFQKAGGDTVDTLKKAGDDTITTVQKAGRDVAATYIKGWRDTGEQAQRSFRDAVEAGEAVGRYTQREFQDSLKTINNATRRAREGKVIDAVWGAATERAQATERNFFTATEESVIVAAAAQSAAAAYGGPAGAAAYAAWHTYKATGDVNLAFKAGALAAVTSAGHTFTNMPAGTAGELLRKSAVTGAVAGVAVFAAGGDERAIKDAFLQSGGAVLVQGASDQLKAYSPKAQDAVQTVQCISARDVDCLSNTTYVKDLKGKIIHDRNGQPRIDPIKLDPKQQIGEWTSIDPASVEGKRNKLMAEISTLPQTQYMRTQAIPIVRDQWVITSTLGKNKQIQHNVPAVVLTYVGTKPPFNSEVQYEKTPTITIPLRSYRSATAKCVGVSDIQDTFDGVAILHGCVTGSKVDYTFNALKGKYVLSATYAGGKETRAVSVAVNGKIVSTNGFGVDTGGLEKKHLKSLLVAPEPISLIDGQNTLTLQAPKDFPHITQLVFVRVPIVIPIDSYRSASKCIGTKNPNFSIPMLHVGCADPKTKVEYIFDAAASGRYFLYFTYAGGSEDRLVDLDVNGRREVSKGLGEYTGGLRPEDSKTILVKNETVILRRGKNSLTLQASGALPHITGIAFRPAQ